MSTAVIVAMYGCITVVLVIDIEKQINQKLKLAENIHWEAIRIIANEIHSRR